MSHHVASLGRTTSDDSSLRRAVTLTSPAELTFVYCTLRTPHRIRTGGLPAENRTSCH